MTPVSLQTFFGILWGRSVKQLLRKKLVQPSGDLLDQLPKQSCDPVQSNAHEHGCHINRQRYAKEDQQHPAFIAPLSGKFVELSVQQMGKQVSAEAACACKGQKASHKWGQLGAVHTQKQTNGNDDHTQITEGPGRGLLEITVGGKNRDGSHQKGAGESGAKSQQGMDLRLHTAEDRTQHIKAKGIQRLIKIRNHHPAGHTGQSA